MTKTSVAVAESESLRKEIELAALRKRVAELESEIMATQAISESGTMAEPETTNGAWPDGAEPISMAGAAKKHGVAMRTVWLWARKYGTVKIIAEVGGAVLVDDRDVAREVAKGVKPGRPKRPLTTC